MQRPGLLLLDGVVYAGFASHCDRQPYVGYVVGVDATTGKQTAMFATETGQLQGGRRDLAVRRRAGVRRQGPDHLRHRQRRLTVAAPGNKPPSQLAESVVRVEVQGTAR